MPCTGFPGRAWTLTPLERNKQNPYQLLSQYRIKVGCHQACYSFCHDKKPPGFCRTKRHENCSWQSECSQEDLPVFASALSRAACYAACLGVGESRRRMAFGYVECITFGRQSLRIVESSGSPELRGSQAKKKPPLAVRQHPGADS